MSLPTNKLHQKTETKIISFPACYVGRFYRNLANNVDSTVNSDFDGRNTNHKEDKYLLATRNFAKGMQDDINLFITYDRLNNASFMRKLDPISKNVF